MHRILTHILFTAATVLLLSACGGARAPGIGDAGLGHVLSASSNSYISWQPPTSYQDESPLPPSKIGGYQIHVGTSEENMRLAASMDPSITKYKLGDLGQGIRYIAVSCYDIYGAESQFTQIIVVDIL